MVFYCVVSAVTKSPLEILLSVPGEQIQTSYKLGCVYFLKHLYKRQLSEIIIVKTFKILIPGLHLDVRKTLKMNNFSSHRKTTKYNTK